MACNSKTGADSAQGSMEARSVARLTNGLGRIAADVAHTPRHDATLRDVERFSALQCVGQGVPKGAGAGTTAVPVWRKVEKKHPYWYFTASSCE